MDPCGDAGIRDQPLRGNVEVRVEVREPAKLHLAVPLDRKAAALELIEPPHRLGGAQQRDRSVRLLADAQVSPDGGVHVADLRGSGAARAQVAAAQHKVVGRHKSHIQSQRGEEAGLRRRHVGRRRVPRRRLVGADFAAAGQRIPGRFIGPLGAGRRVLRRDHVRQRLLRVGTGEQQQDAVDLQPRRVGAHLPLEPRLAQVAGQLQVRLEMDVTQLVVDHLEVVGVDPDVDGAGLTLVEREVSLDPQRFPVFVLDLEGRNVDAVLQQFESGGQAGETDVGLRHAERAVLQIDIAVQVGIAARAGDPHVRLDRPGDVGQGGGEPLDDPQVHPGGLDRQVNRIAGRGLTMAGLALRRRAQRAHRQRALGCELGAGHLHQPGVEADPVSRVGHVGGERLVLELLEAAIRDGRAAGDLGRAGASGDPGVGIEPAGKAAVLQRQLFQLRDVDVLGAHRHGAELGIVAEGQYAGDVELLIGVDQPDILQLDPVVAVLDGRRTARGVLPLDAQRAQGQIGQVQFVVLGMEHHAAAGVDLARAAARHAGSRRHRGIRRGLHHARLEGDGAVGVAGGRREHVDLDGTDLDEGALRLRLHVGACPLQIRDGDRVCAIEIERLVVLVAEIRTVHRADRAERRGIPGNRAIEHDRPGERLIHQLAEAGQVGRGDVILQVRLTDLIEGDVAGRLDVEVRPLDGGLSQRAAAVGILALDVGRIDGEARHVTLRQSDPTVR